MLVVCCDEIHTQSRVDVGRRGSGPPCADKPQPQKTKGHALLPSEGEGGRGSSGAEAGLFAATKGAFSVFALADP